MPAACQTPYLTTWTLCEAGCLAAVEDVVGRGGRGGRGGGGDCTELRNFFYCAHQVTRQVRVTKFVSPSLCYQVRVTKLLKF
ncbi:hypothetical protein OAM67_01550 [bacterium]|nr:hypothetical protein [bacterium]